MRTRTQGRQGRRPGWPGVRRVPWKLSLAPAAAAAVAFEPLYHLPDCQAGTFLTAWEGGQGSHGNRAKNPGEGEKNDEIESGPEIKIANS